MTTRFKTIGAFPALLLTVIFLAKSSAEARPPRAREVSATIQTINHDKRTMSVENSHGSGLRELVWNSDTKFLHDWEFVPAAELRSGTHATVSYRTPFFGKPFVTRIVWINQRQPG